MIDMIFQSSSLNAAGAIIGLIVAIFKTFKFVKEGERGVKMRFGKVRRDKDGKPLIVEPGFVMIIPFMDKIQSHHVRQQSDQFTEQRIVLKDGLIYKVSGMVIFKVFNVYSAMFEIDNLYNSVNDVCMAAIKDELEQRNHDQLRDASELSQRIIAKVLPRVEEWGISIIQLSLPECAPTQESANLINASLSVKLRLDALKKGLQEHDLTLATLNPSLAAVLVGMPMVATVDNAPPVTVKSKSSTPKKDGDGDKVDDKNDE
jgi:regulator of protease activity HflC (stomatin/prohibitin superfamily)